MLALLYKFLYVLRAFSGFADKAGARQEDTQFHNVVVFGSQADTVGRFLKKGSSALIEGRMQTRSWDDKTSGEKKYRTEIVADRVQFGPRSEGQAPAGGSSAPSAGGKAAGAVPEALQTIEYPEEDINPDDIPF